MEERARLPVRFGAPPAPANGLPPPPALAKAGDDPPEEAYEDCPWASDDRSAYDDRADGAEHDWPHQRRYGYGEIYDPWAPEEREERRRDRLERDDWQGGGEEDFDADNPLDMDWPEDGQFAPEHDRT